MALSFKFKPIDVIHRVHKIANGALAGIEGAPGLKIVNHSLNPNPDPQALSERTGFEALLNTSGAPTLHIAPPSKLARELGDWSSPEAVERSARAAMFCCEAYAKALGDSGIASPEAVNKAKAALNIQVARAFEAAREALAPPEGARISQASANMFAAACERVGDRGDLAQMAAARQALSQIPADEAKALMIQSDLVFGADPGSPAPAELALPASTLPTLNRGGENAKKGAFKLFANGSFSSRLHAASDSPAELARLIAEPGFSLGLEHMVHRHFLKTPDGEVHGAENIDQWARDTLRHIEAFEISLLTGSAPKSARPGL